MISVRRMGSGSTHRAVVTPISISGASRRMASTTVPITPRVEALLAVAVTRVDVQARDAERRHGAGVAGEVARAHRDRRVHVGRSGTVEAALQHRGDPPSTCDPGP